MHTHTRAHIADDWGEEVLHLLFLSLCFCNKKRLSWKMEKVSLSWQKDKHSKT